MITTSKANFICVYLHICNVTSSPEKSGHVLLPSLGHLLPPLPLLLLHLVLHFICLCYLPLLQQSDNAKYKELKQPANMEETDLSV